jgi:hypothetical protein
VVREYGINAEGIMHGLDKGKSMVYGIPIAQRFGTVIEGDIIGFERSGWTGKQGDRRKTYREYPFAVMTVLRS